MFDMGQMQRMQLEMQERLEKIQGEMKDVRMMGTAGGGAVKVTCDGNQEILAVEIKKGIVDVNEEDLEMLQDLFIAAANQAIEKSKEQSQKSMNAVTGGLKIPGLTM